MVVSDIGGFKCGPNATKGHIMVKLTFRDCKHTSGKMVISVQVLQMWLETGDVLQKTGKATVIPLQMKDFIHSTNC